MYDAGKSRLGQERSRFYSGMAWTTVGSAVAQALNALLLPLLTRLYSPVDFGIFAVIQSLAGLGSSIGGFRYEYALVLAKSDRMAAALVLAQWLSVAGVTAIAALFVYAAAGHLQMLEPATAWLWAVPTIIGLAGGAQSTAYYLVRAGDFKQLSLMRVLQAVLTSGLPVLGGFRSVGAGGLIVAFVIGLGVSSIKPTLLLIRHLAGAIRRAANVGSIRRAARAHFRFPLYSVPYGFMGAARERGLLLLVAGFVAVDVAGAMAVAMRLSFFPASFLSTALGPVIYREAANLGKHTEHFRRLLRRMMIFLGVVLAPLVVLLLMYGESIFGVLLGQSWRNAGRFVSILAIPSLTLVLSGLLDRLFDVRKRQRLAFTIESVYSCVALAVVVVLFAKRVSPTTTLAAFAVVTSTYHLVWMILAYREWRLPLTDLLSAFALTGASAFATLVAIELFPLPET